jgi:hypothetical protein
MPLGGGLPLYARRAGGLEVLIPILYQTADGGRQAPLRFDLYPWFSCPCKIRKEDDNARDFRSLNGGMVLEPGQTRRVGIVFLPPEQAILFQGATNDFLPLGGRDHWRGKDCR